MKSIYSFTIPEKMSSPWTLTHEYRSPSASSRRRIEATSLSNKYKPPRLTSKVKSLYHITTSASDGKVKKRTLNLSTLNILNINTSTSTNINIISPHYHHKKNLPPPPQRQEYLEEEIHITREEDRRSEYRPSRQEEEEVYIREERRPEHKHKHHSASFDINTPHHHRHFEASFERDSDRHHKHTEVNIELPRREHNHHHHHHPRRPSSEADYQLERVRQPSRYEHSELDSESEFSVPQKSPTETQIDFVERQYRSRTQPKNLSSTHHQHLNQPLPIFKPVNLEMGYYDDEAGAPVVAAPKQPPNTVTIPCHTSVIRITTSAATGQHRYLGVDLFTRQLNEESSFIANPSPSVVVQTMLGPVFKQYRVLDLQDHTVVAMTETGDVKQAVPVLDQSNLWTRLKEAFEGGRGSIRIMVVADGGREIAVDMKTVHGSRL
ncbi:hypothetical protein DID88_001524 [Monilinia fructigena]|uniref:Translation elongation factor IF5A C-terminal domain-containing protein n=1 Tax=Monilinia fructigena TaxID=38457 RepID=A0A395IXE3_9HELO|nr:hypothetical protein DID88_001524 [Monilinia fructigena]